MATGKANRLLFRDGDIPVSKLVGRGFETNFRPKTYGNIWYVDSAHAAAANKAATGWGKDQDHPFDTIATAVSQSLILQGDVIIVNRTHTESISAADAWKWANAGVYVLGMGWPGSRPVITFDTATTATILMDKQGCVIENMDFVCGIDSLALMIQMTASYNAIIDCLLLLDDSSKQALIGIDMGNVAADNCAIQSSVFKAASAGCNSAIKVATAVDALVIGNCRVSGDFADACIHNPTGNVATDILVHDCLLRNTQTGDHSLEFVSAVTGDLV